MKIKANLYSASTRAASRNRYLPYVYGFIAVCASLLNVPVGSAQTADTGAIAGTVTDASGGAVPQATIKVVNETTGDTHGVVSQGNGSYKAALLLPGTYRIEVSKSGFKTAVVTRITVLVTETGATNIKLQVGDITETVTVNAQPDILQTNSAALGTSPTRGWWRVCHSSPATTPKFSLFRLACRGT